MGVDGEKLGNQDLRDLNINFPNSSNPNAFNVSQPAELGLQLTEYYIETD